MNKFREKRNSLENYVKEQIIGPGAYNKKYFFIADWDKSEFSGKDLSKVKAIQNVSEVITEVPAYQYSSAILFPVTTQSTQIENIDTNEEVENKIDGDVILNTSADDENTKEDTSSNVVLTQQNYPNTFGLSFVLNKDKDINKDLKITLSYRKYIHIKKEVLSRKIAINIKEYKDEIKAIVMTYLHSVFGVEEKDSNLFIYPKRKFEQEDIYSIDYELLNNYVKKEFITVLDNVFSENIVVLKDENEVKYFGLKETNIQFYSISESKHNHSNVYTIFNNSIISFIKKELGNNVNTYSKYKHLIKVLEIYNQLIEITTDLKTIVKAKSATPIWESEHHTKEINLPEIIKDQTIQRESLTAIDESDKESLHYSVQYITKEDKVYVKLLIVNTNQYELKIDEPPQLNKKDKANKLSFFGVELKITENCAE